MKTINNLTPAGLADLANILAGKVWQKGDKTRIYVTGGNNFQYDGNWYYEIYDDGNWEAKVFLNSGYGNANREEYVNKHLRMMEEAMNNAITEAQAYSSDDIDKEISPDTAQPRAVEYKGFPAVWGDNDYEYPANFYNGCGSYYLAFQDRRIVGSVNFSSSMQRIDLAAEAYLMDECKKRGLEVQVYPADGSGVTFFFRNESHAQMAGINYKTYTVPKAGGGRHKNIEMIVEEKQ